MWNSGLENLSCVLGALELRRIMMIAVMEMGIMMMMISKNGDSNRKAKWKKKKFIDLLLLLLLCVTFRVVNVICRVFPSCFVISSFHSSPSSVFRLSIPLPILSPRRRLCHRLGRGFGFSSSEEAEVSRNRTRGKEVMESFQFFFLS